MDPPRSVFHRSCERMGEVVRRHMKIFTIETTLNGHMFPPILGFLQKREYNWNLFDHVSYHSAHIGLPLLPGPLRRKAYTAFSSPYGLTGVHAGDTESVHKSTLENVLRQQRVPVPHQYDIVILGLPSIGPYSVNSIVNPILVNCTALGYFFNFHMHRPLVRKGGILLLVHPIENKFHMVHHPSYFDFFEDLLPQTRDPAELERRFEASYATNERYIHLYRKSYAYHGVHPFYMWYWAAHGNDHVGKVIAVHPKSEMAARRLGYEVAPTLDTALGMAKDIAGQGASTCYFHCPPIVMCDVPSGP